MLIDDPALGRAHTSPRAVLLRMVTDDERDRRRAWALALSHGAAPVADVARLGADRRVEAARLLGTTPDAHEIPCEPTGAVSEIAAELLAATRDYVATSHAEYQDVLAEALGRSFAEGWPAQLSPRWLHDLFHPTGLTEGLDLDLGPLPAALGATSFARALAVFGEALAVADGPTGVPFSMAHHPFDVRHARRAALFGSLVADPLFGVRARGLDRAHARAEARGVMRALVLGLRTDALRVLLRGALVLPEGQRRRRFEEQTEAALGTPIPFAVAGVVPSLSPSDATRFIGALVAMSDRRALVERFDDDWFRSPHAARAIREEDAAAAAPSRVTAARVREGLAELVALLSRGA